MLIRYDFGEKLDLSRFKKSAEHYIKTIALINYHFVFKNYKMIVEIGSDLLKNNFHSVSICLFDISRDSDGEIINNNNFSKSVIIPASDVRFKEFKSIMNIFSPYDHKAYFESNSVNQTIDKLCSIINIVFKINNLKVFI